MGLIRAAHPKTIDDSDQLFVAKSEDWPNSSASTSGAVQFTMSSWVLSLPSGPIDQMLGSSLPPRVPGYS